jgi:hypothetical protein
VPQANGSGQLRAVPNEGPADDDQGDDDDQVAPEDQADEDDEERQARLDEEARQAEDERRKRLAEEAIREDRRRLLDSLRRWVVGVSAAQAAPVIAELTLYSALGTLKVAEQVTAKLAVYLAGAEAPGTRAEDYEILRANSEKAVDVARLALATLLAAACSTAVRGDEGTRGEIWAITQAAAVRGGYEAVELPTFDD